jgi:hypothetical protein
VHSCDPYTADVLTTDPNDPNVGRDEKAARLSFRTVLPPAYRRLVEATRRQVATVLMTELPKRRHATSL